MIYSISYELKSQDKDYNPLYSFFENELGDSSIHVLRDTWWIHTVEEQKIENICSKVKEYILEGDVFYVIEIHEVNINGWLAAPVWNWYKIHK